MKNYKVQVIIEPCEEGGYFATCPALQGCHAEGETYLDALENIQDIIRIHLESRAELGTLTSGQAEVASLIDTFKVELVVPVSV
ncbi:MAG: type II toxin-antitoxin system HicB family antitoxin [Methanosarcinales archaeon]|nr:type II toxin-antitoxin system HicB family antitoxin [Methanosarcinales archaeon]